jgi:hypothetical protein
MNIGRDRSGREANLHIHVLQRQLVTGSVPPFPDVCWAWCFRKRWDDMSYRATVLTHIFKELASVGSHGVYLQYSEPIRSASLSVLTFPLHWSVREWNLIVWLFDVPHMYFFEYCCHALCFYPNKPLACCWRRVYAYQNAQCTVPSNLHNCREVKSRIKVFETRRYENTAREKGRKNTAGR